MRDAPAGLAQHIGTAIAVLGDGAEAVPGDFSRAGSVALRAACNCGWRASADCPLLDGEAQAERLWRSEHMLPLCALGEEPASERIGRDLVDRMLNFQHNLPFAETSPLEGLRAAARIRQIADLSVHQLLAVALRQNLPLQQVADALGTDPSALQADTGYPDHPSRP
ncbi:hypothetical protein JJV70_16010 [Streptomyces sp. JJ66]|uniref:hypothetical protein n=1 Tax=Streptomyces sp. JJ66 TaxID=2803843 RepID=UPI001C5691CA|nr:hypothetical protein [Streptomyces sp. JJ66]MBW1603581.1 hypothetical protein [Streptomyces sp. JJ66]